MERAGKRFRAPALLLLAAVVFLLAAAPVLAWLSARAVSADNRLGTARTGGTVQLWACDGGEQPDRAGARLLSEGNGDAAGRPFLTVEGWLPGQTVTRFLLVRSFEAAPRAFQFDFRLSSDSLLSEAVSVTVAPWEDGEKAVRPAVLEEAALSELEGYTLCGTVPAAGGEVLAVGGDTPVASGDVLVADGDTLAMDGVELRDESGRPYAEAVYRFTFVFSPTASAVYANRTVELEVGLSLFQTGDRLLSIHSMEELRTALSYAALPEGGYAYCPEYDPDRPEYVGAAADPEADLRARLGGTLHILTDFELEGSIALHKQVNLYFTGTLRIAGENRLSIDIPETLANAGPMDIGAAGDPGGLELEGDPALLLEIRAPESVAVNWRCSTCGPLPDSANARGLRSSG